MLAWLVVEADLPNAVYMPLVGALVAWAPLMGEHLFPIEPEAGVHADLRQVLEEMWWWLEAEAAQAGWAERVVLDEVRGRVSLAVHALRARHALALGLPVPRSPGG